MATIQVPNNYGYVILTCAVLPTLTSMFVLGGEVMKARSKFDVQYPNLYAVPKYHEKADDFNRVQRGHQNFLEGLTSYTVMSMAGGLLHPIAVSIGGVFFCLGSVFYQKGYADTKLDVSWARYKKGGMMKWFGFFTSLICSVKFAGSLQGWW